MYSSTDIANYFLSNSIRDNTPVSNLKLQKLVYLAHGFFGALKEQPLLNENIEAWPFGPVIRELYFKYKNFGNQTITISKDDFQNLPVFSSEAMKALDFTWKTAKDFDAVQLSNWTHIDGSPWKQALEEKREIIPNEYIFKYFKKFLKAKPAEATQV